MRHLNEVEEVWCRALGLPRVDDDFAHPGGPSLVKCDINRLHLFKFEVLRVLPHLPHHLQYMVDERKRHLSSTLHGLARRFVHFICRVPRLSEVGHLYQLLWVRVRVKVKIGQLVLEALGEPLRSARIFVDLFSILLRLLRPRLVLLLVVNLWEGFSKPSVEATDQVDLCLKDLCDLFIV